MRQIIKVMGTDTIIYMSKSGWSMVNRFVILQTWFVTNPHNESGFSCYKVSHSVSNALINSILNVNCLGVLEFLQDS